MRHPNAITIYLRDTPLGAMLAGGILPAIAGIASSALFAVFVAAIGYNLIRGRQFDCGCGGAEKRPISWQLVLRDVALAACAVAVAVGPSAALSIWRGWGWSTTRSASVANLVAVPMAVLLVVVMGRTIVVSSRVIDRRALIGWTRWRDQTGLTTDTVTASTRDGGIN